MPLRLLIVTFALLLSCQKAEKTTGPTFSIHRAEDGPLHNDDGTLCRPGDLVMWDGRKSPTVSCVPVKVTVGHHSIEPSGLARGQRPASGIKTSNETKDDK